MEKNYFIVKDGKVDGKAGMTKIEAAKVVAETQAKIAKFDGETGKYNLVNLGDVNAVPQEVFDKYRELAKLKKEKAVIDAKIKTINAELDLISMDIAADLIAAGHTRLGSNDGKNLLTLKERNRFNSKSAISDIERTPALKEFVSYEPKLNATKLKKENKELYEQYVEVKNVVELEDM